MADADKDEGATCKGNEESGLRRRVQASEQSDQVPVTNISASTAANTDTRQPARKLSRTHSGTRIRTTQNRNRISQSLQNGSVLGNPPTTWFQHNKEGPPLTYKTEVNVLFWAVVLMGFLVRFWKLDFPHFIVFDEVHFGKFASYYLQRTFFFDVHPPLGKLIYAAVGYLAGYDGSFLFPNIGIEFPFTVPYVTMRSASALCGSLLIPCVYNIMLELGFSHRAALLAGFFTVFDNSLVIQSRVIMLDSFVIFFTCLSVLCFLKFYHQRNRPFSESWHRWLIYTGLALGLLTGVKYSGLLGLGCIGLLTICDLWQLLADKAIDTLELMLHFLLRGFYLLGIPLVMNILFFYIHFTVLSQAGPGNAFVSHPFRNSLEGSVETPLAELSPNATLLRYSHQFSLRSSDVSCWLHSHEHLYPLKYPDGRGSSYQQQVTCYDFKDPNNMWAIRRSGDPSNTSLTDDNTLVRNGDEVELIHILSGKLLNSHDVAAPLSPSLQEVAGYINYSAAFTPYLKWEMSVVGLERGDPLYWEPGKLRLKLHHTFSKQALACTGKRLPEWGFQQYEVVTDKAVDEGQTLWQVEELQATNQTRVNNETREEEGKIKNEWLEKKQSSKQSDEEFVTTKSFSFLEKYFEIQHHMFTAHGNLGEHTFGTSPQNWPLMGKTLPYWLDENSNSQVTLLGNPVLWWFASSALCVFVCLTAVYTLARRRVVNIIESDEFYRWSTNGSVLAVGWLVHYLPYFLFSRVLFLHHYLPALPFKIMLLAAVCDHLFLWSKRMPSLLRPTYYISMAFLCVAVVTTFFVFAPFTYGFPSLTLEQIRWRHWVETWDLLHRVVATHG